MTLKAVAPRGLGSLPALPGNKPSFLLLNHSQWSLPGLLCAGQPVSPFPDGLTMWLSCPPAASGGCCKSVVKEERTVKSITTTVQMGACDQGRLWSQIVLLCYCVIVLSVFRSWLHHPLAGRQQEVTYSKPQSFSYKRRLLLEKLLVLLCVTTVVCLYKTMFLFIF